MGAYAAAAGLIMDTVGGVLAGNAAEQKRKQMFDVANTPGLDISGTVGGALQGYQAAMPLAQGVAGDINTFQNQQLKQTLTGSIPGYQSMLDTQSGDIMAYLRGEVPQDVQDLIRTKSAEWGAGAGVPGSEGVTNASLRSLGLTSLGMMEKGFGASNAFRNSVPYMSPVNLETLLGPTPAAQVGIRSNERTQKMNYLAQLAGMPGQTGVWANTLTQMGGALLGGGLASMGGPNAGGVDSMGVGPGSNSTYQPPAGGGWDFGGSYYGGPTYGG